MTRLSLLSPLLLTPAVLAAGCSAQPQAHPVRGTVTYKGKPVFDGQPEAVGVVVFHPFDPNLPTAKGDIAPDGSFSLTTYKPGDGAPAGDWKVTVHAYVPTRGIEGVDKDYRPARPLVPERYTILDATPLRAAVGLGDNVIPLSLNP